MSKRNRRSRREEQPPVPESVELDPLPGQPRILAREEHYISRKNIDDDCLKVMRRLIRYGHRAFLVGGGVRDLLLERTPKDFDVSTDASPEQVRKLFRNSRIIGRRFRLNHVFFKGGKTIEVSTFRQDNSDDEEVQTLAKDNTFGDPETDAIRRDLTINGLFYDLSTFSIVDYVGGIEDLKNKIVRVIGVPEVRFTEDPVRMIRAVRHAARTGFTIEEKTAQAVRDNADIISLCPKARLFEEFQREVSGGYSVASFSLLEELGLLPYLFPKVSEIIASSKEARALFFKRLEAVDAAYVSGQQPRLGIIFGSLLFDLLDADLRENNPLLLPFWQSAHEDIPEESIPLGSPKGSSKAKRRQSPLLQYIDSLFEEIGLPRKERERLEKAMVTRLSFFEYGPDDSFGRKLRRSSSYEDALLLAQLADVDGVQKELLEQWQQASKKSDSNSRGRPKRRRRRRSSRKNSPKNAPKQKKGKSDSNE